MATPSEDDRADLKPIDAPGAGDVSADGAMVDRESVDQPLHEARSQPRQHRAVRAGRNLPAAVAVGVVLGVGLVLIPIYTVPRVFLAIIALAMVAAVWEISTALRTKAIAPPFLPLAAGAVGCVVGAYAAQEEGLLVAYVLTALAVIVWRMTEGAPGFLRDVSAGVFVATYIPLLAGFAALMVMEDQGADRILAFILTTVCSDVGGYAAGVLFGKHPMAPTISPKKSWEGFGGSLLFCAVSGALTFDILLGADWWKGVIFGLVICVSATLGDLGESMIKRDLGVKDMGRLLPGHGGLMDRLDSLLPTAPVAWLLLSLFVPGG